MGRERLGGGHDSQFDLTLGHQLGGNVIIWYRQLGRDCVLQPELFNELRYTGHRKIGDRFCVQERTLKAFD